MLPFDEKNKLESSVAKDQDPLMSSAKRMAMNKFMAAVKSDMVDAALDAYQDLAALCSEGE